jgi:hypothetical protein
MFKSIYHWFNPTFEPSTHLNTNPDPIIEREDEVLKAFSSIPLFT